MFDCLSAKAPGLQPRGFKRQKRKNDPDGNRTRVTGVKGRCPRPLDDGAPSFAILAQNVPAVPLQSAWGAGNAKLVDL